MQRAEGGRDRERELSATLSDGMTFCAMQARTSSLLVVSAGDSGDSGAFVFPHNRVAPSAIEPANVPGSVPSAEPVRSARDRGRGVVDEGNEIARISYQFLSQCRLVNLAGNVELAQAEAPLQSPDRLAQAGRSIGRNVVTDYQYSPDQEQMAAHALHFGRTNPDDEARCRAAYFPFSVSLRPPMAF